MKKFSFVARSDEGQKVKGIIEAISVEGAKNLLFKRGYHIIELVEKRRKASLWSRLGLHKKVGQNELTNFTRQLSTMLNAGLPLTDALEILASQANGSMRKVLEQILVDIREGSSLGSALSHYPSIFNRVYISLVRSGEAAGALDKVLERLADNLEKNRDFMGKVKGALIYPAIVIIAMALVAAVMMIVVIPKLNVLYQSFHTQLPLSTRILITFSDFMVRFWWLLLIGLIGLINLVQWVKKTPWGGYLWDKITVELPVWGSLQQEVIWTNFSYTLSMLLEAGVPLISALDISAETTGNKYYSEEVKAVRSQVEKGIPMSTAMEISEVFPRILSQMVSIGEQTGEMDKVLYKLAHYFEVEASQKVKNLTTSIEPIIIIILSLGVGFLVFSIITPIYNLTSQF